MPRSPIRSSILLACLAVGLAAAEGDLADRPLGDAMRIDFGAAAFLPADVTGFSATHQLATQVSDIWNSQPVQSLMRSPAAIMGMMQLQQHPGYQQAMQLRYSPLGQQVLAALHQLVADETFVALGADAGPRLAAWLEAVNEIYVTNLVATIEGGANGGEHEPSAADLVAAYLAYADELAVPSMMIGAKLFDPPAVTGLIDTYLPQAMAATTTGSYRGPVEGETWAHRFDVTGAEVLAGEEDRLRQQLAAEGVAPEATEELIAHVGALTLAVEITLRDDYLLIAIGADRSLLASWGADQSLAASPAFRPMRALYRPGLAALSYQSPVIESLFGWTPESCAKAAEQLEAVIAELPDLPQALRQRLVTDARAFLDEVATQLPPASAMTSCTYREQGLRTWRVRAGVMPGTGAVPASVAHGLAGVAPLLALSSGGVNRPDDVATVAKWVRTGYDYVREFGLPELDEADRAEAELALGAVETFGVAVERALVDHLLPGLGPNSESVLLIEEGGRLVDLPPEAGLRDGIAVPRAALAIALTDPEAFQRGIGALVEAVEALARELSALPDSDIPADFAVPRPQRAAVEGGACFGYPDLARFGSDLEPVVAVGGDLLVIGSSRSLVTELLTRERGDGDLARDEGEVMRFTLDVAAWSAQILAAAETLIQAQMAMAPGRNQSEMTMVLTHLQILNHSLQSIAGFDGSLRVSDGHTVVETWLKVAPR